MSAPEAMLFLSPSTPSYACLAPNFLGVDRPPEGPDMGGPPVTESSLAPTLAKRRPSPEFRFPGTRPDLL